MEDTDTQGTQEKTTRSPELREGNSYRAKFFRWKDGVLPDATKYREASDLIAKEKPDLIQELSESRKAIQTEPDSEEAYRRAVTAIRETASIMKKAGLIANPDFPEET